MTLRRRITPNPKQLRDQLRQAAAAIPAEPNWPATAPVEIQVRALASSIADSLTRISALKSQLSQARAELKEQTKLAYTTMRRIDETTDCLYGANGPGKTSFGLMPKRPRGPSVPLQQVVFKLIRDGVAPSSIFLDWDWDQAAAAYQIEWYADAAMIQQVGNAAVSESQYEIVGLIAGRQYWIRVRAIRSSEYGPWSDPGTRIANL